MLLDISKPGVCGTCSCWRQAHAAHVLKKLLSEIACRSSSLSCY